MAHITVWDREITTIHIQRVLFYEGRESVDTVGCYVWRMHNGASFERTGRWFRKEFVYFVLSYYFFFANFAVVYRGYGEHVVFLFISIEITRNGTVCAFMI